MNQWIARLVSLGLLVLMLEGVLRLLGASPLITINQFDEKLGWSKTPSSSTRKSTSEFDVTFAINPLGVRDDADLTLKKSSPEELRVLIVGDSFPLGYTVERDDLFVDILERRLTEQGRQAEVINGGTEGFSTDQYVLWLDDIGAQFEPDVVVVTAYQNDIYWNSQEAYVNKAKPRFAIGSAGRELTNESYPLPPSAEASWWARHTAIGGLVNNLSVMVRYASSLTYKTSSGKTMERENTVLLCEEPDFVTESWQYTRTALEALRRVADEKELSLVLALIPNREQIHSEFADAYRQRFGLLASEIDFDRPNRKLKELALEAGLTVFDPIDRFKEKAREIGRPLYFEKDWHFNPEGNQLFAECLHIELERGGWIPPTNTDAASIHWEPGRTEETALWPWGLGTLWIILSVLYRRMYPDEPLWSAALKIAALLTTVVLIIAGLQWLGDQPGILRWIPTLMILAFVGIIVAKVGSKLSIMKECWGTFVRAGHWYMLPLLMVLLTVGSLLVVAASSPLIAPFIYTLF